MADETSNTLPSFRQSYVRRVFDPASFISLSICLVFVVIAGSPLAGVVHTNFPVEYENRAATLAVSTTGYCLSFVDTNGQTSNNLTCQAAAFTYSLGQFKFLFFFIDPALIFSDLQAQPFSNQIRLAGFTHVFMGSYGVLLVSALALFSRQQNHPVVSVGFTAFAAASSLLLSILELVFATKGRNQPLILQNIGPAMIMTFVFTFFLILAAILGWGNLPPKPKNKRRRKEKKKSKKGKKESDTDSESGSETA